MRMTTLAVLALLTGCEAPSHVAATEAWRWAPATHVCTAEQMERAQAETSFCADNTGFNSEYCYGSAILRNCSAPQQPTGEEG